VGQKEEIKFKVRILSHEFEITIKDLNDLSPHLMGRSLARRGRILLADDLSHDVARSTLIHELLHAVETLFSLDLPDHVIDIFALAVYSMLKDNPHLVQFLTAKPDDEEFLRRAFEQRSKREEGGDNE